MSPRCAEVSAQPARLAVLCVAFAAVAACGGRGGAGDASEKETIFSVDGDPATLGDFHRFADDAVPSEDYASLDDRTRSRLLEQFLEHRILLHEARRRGVRVDDAEVRQELERLPVVPDEPPPDVDSPVLRRKMEEAILVRKYRDEMLLRDIAVTPEKVRELYESNVEEYERDRQVLLSQIFVDTEEAASSVLARLRKGEDFDRVAQISESPIRGPDRFQSIADLPPVIAEAVAQMSPGDTSGILRSSNGYHIVRLEQVREARSLTVEEAGPEIQKKLLAEEAERRIREIVNGVRRSERFVFRPEALDFSYRREESDTEEGS